MNKKVKLKIGYLNGNRNQMINLGTFTFPQNYTRSRNFKKCHNHQFQWQTL